MLITFLWRIILEKYYFENQGDNGKIEFFYMLLENTDITANIDICCIFYHVFSFMKRQAFYSSPSKSTTEED
jgi:hypothetical protein